MLRQAVLLAFLLSSFVYAEDISLQLNKPYFKKGVLATDNGGVVSGKDMRIQAEKISYVNKTEDGISLHYLTAEGDLLFCYQGNIYVGERLDYDFLHNKAFITNGKTLSGLWYLGGKNIEINNDRSVHLTNSYLTTSESQNFDWDINAQEASISSSEVLTAKDIGIRYKDTPIFWLPYFQSSLSFITDPPVRYNITWDKGLGPRLSARYRFASTPVSDFYLRLDYRVAKAWGGALETEYRSEDERTYFLSRNYGASDKNVPDERAPMRFRFQGVYHTHSEDDSLQVDLSYDRVSSQKMFETFKNEDFELNTRKRTRLKIKKQESDTFGVLRVEPRVNNYLSLNQELPLGIIGARPLNLGSSPIIMENRVQAAYLDYKFASGIKNSIHDFHAARLETRQQFYIPLSAGPVSFSPKAGFNVIYYSNSPQNVDRGQFVFNYGAKANTLLMRSFGRLRHTVEPYLNFQAMANPSIPTDEHYIFGINDGLVQQSAIKFGAENSFYFDRAVNAQPSLTADIFTYAFFKQTIYTDVIPKLYAKLTTTLPYLFFNAYGAWNFPENRLDFSNFISKLTLNKKFAIALELRYRSAFAFRKSNYDNFAYEFVRSLDDVLASPASDKRYTVLGKLEWRLAHNWLVRYQTQNGWGRDNEPGYTTQKVDLVNDLGDHWKLRLSYEQMPNDKRVTYSLKLVK